MPLELAEAPALFRGAEAEDASWLRLAFLNQNDTALRMAAFERIRRLNDAARPINSGDLDVGFFVGARRFPIYNPRRGIFKPKEMKFLLSIKTVVPRPGNRIWYDDQIEVHDQIYAGNELIEYAFMGSDPEHQDNRNLARACEFQIPIIYFLGVAPGLYQALAPAFVTNVDSIRLRASISFGLESGKSVDWPESSTERRYALRAVKQRLHQAAFREAVISAYRGRCALSGLPEPMLLDAAHIIADGDDKLGQPLVQNGLPLSKTHHAAFDAHLIGIDPLSRIHVSKRLLALQDGPVLESMKALDGRQLRPPIRPRDAPDRDRLEARFKIFKEAA